MGTTGDRQAGHGGVEDLVARLARDLESADRSAHRVRAYAVAVRDFLS